MKKTLVSALLAAFLLPLGCSKHNDNSSNNTNSSSDNSANLPKGGVLFWTSDNAELNTCGALTIVLNNGQQTNITGYYNGAPPDCVNQVGGYLYLAQGLYTYTVTTSGGCSIAGGSISVIGNQCNLFRIP